jgi:hypothetical protein
MAAFLSDQMTAVAAGSKIKANESYGRVRRMFFSHTLAGAMTLGDTISLGVIPKGSRILGGQFCWSATQGATATTAIGIASSAAKYFAAAVTASAAVFRVADTQAQNYGVETTADETILATNAAAAWTVASVLKGHIDFMVD